MGLLDKAEAKAKELAEQAKEALANKDDLIAKAKERLDAGVAELKEDLGGASGKAAKMYAEAKDKIAKKADELASQVDESTKAPDATKKP
ncbi:MAG TPA: hypothetical protein VEI06_08040 [Gemmatimonadaceae bacterium]|nr:hypothetical protein [Gemmatimonadaceae bacterium]